MNGSGTVPRIWGLILICAAAAGVYGGLELQEHHQRWWFFAPVYLVSGIVGIIGIVLLFGGQEGAKALGEIGEGIGDALGGDGFSFGDGGGD